MTPLEKMGAAFIAGNVLLYVLRKPLAPGLTGLFNGVNTSRSDVPELTGDLVARTLGVMWVVNAAGTATALFLIRFFEIDIPGAWN